MFKLPPTLPARTVLPILLFAGWLGGCGGSEDDPRERASPDEVSAPEPAVDSAPAAEPPRPLKVAMQAEVAMGDDRRLTISGSTNLPDSAQLLVIIERETSGARWHERVQVTGGAFEAGPMGFGSGVPDGEYRVRVQLSEASIQPDAVQARLGTRGEALEGELVRQAPHGLGKIAVYSREFTIGSRLRRMQEKGDKVRYPDG